MGIRGINGEERVGENGKLKAQKSVHITLLPGLSHLTSCESPKLSPVELSKRLPSWEISLPTHPESFLLLPRCPLLRCFAFLDDLRLQLNKTEIVLLPKLVRPAK